MRPVLTRARATTTTPATRSADSTAASAMRACRVIIAALQLSGAVCRDSRLVRAHTPVFESAAAGPRRGGPAGGRPRGALAAAPDTDNSLGLAAARRVRHTDGRLGCR